MSFRNRATLVLLLLSTPLVSARAAEMRARGVDVYPFGVGEPDFEPAAFVREAAKAAIDRGASKYTAVTGIARAGPFPVARAFPVAQALGIAETNCPGQLGEGR